VTRQIVLNTIASASLAGVEVFDLVHESAGDIFADWPDAPPR